MSRLHLFFTFFRDRLRHQSSRVRQLKTLRTRWQALDTQETWTKEQRHLGQEMRQLREQIAESLEGVHSCRECGKGCPLPEGQWDGGFCCGGRTEELFPEAELASLCAGGIKSHQPTAPRGPHAGCVFRGATGCTLSPAQRPNLCLTYMCRDLSRELATRPNAKHLLHLCDELTNTFKEFQKTRKR